MPRAVKRRVCGFAFAALLCGQSGSSDRAMTLWLDLKKAIAAPKGDEYFELSCKDAVVPGGANGVQHFRGKLIVHTPDQNPDQLVLAVEAEGVIDAQIKLSRPLTGSMRAGSEISFSGVLKGFRKSPYELTFESEPRDIEGWRDQGPPRPNPE